jgi:uncharacterized protein
MVVSRWSLLVRRWSFVVGLAVALALATARPSSPQPPASNLPALTQPVNDFANVIDPASARAMDRMIRALLAASGDAVVVATVPTIEPYGDIREYTVKLFENHGRGVGQKGKNNGLLILLALKERSVRVEVGYDLEEWVTDGFAGETSRTMTPEFRNGRYGPGLLVGTERIIGRIAQGRRITLDGVREPRQTPPQRGTPFPVSIPFIIFIIILIISRLGGGPGRRSRFWGGMGGWSSGVGPFGGGFGGGGSGGGFGGGFGGFGGGSSGGGGGGSSW